MLQSPANFTSVPKLKLGNTQGVQQAKQQGTLTRENMLQLTQKQSIENQHMMLQKNNSNLNANNTSNNTPNSLVRPSNSKQGSGLFSTPKDASQLNSPLQSSKAFQESSARVGAFSDYYNKECSKQTSRLPSINKSTSSTTKFQSVVGQDDVVPRPKNATFSSDVSNFDLASTSTADNLNFKGKSSFFKPKQHAELSQFHLLAKDSSNSNDSSNSTSQMHLSNQNLLTKSLSLNISKKDSFFQPQNYLVNNNSNNYNSINNNYNSYGGGVDSPLNFVNQATFLNKQQQQQQQLKALHEEQKKQLQRVEDITSPFPPKSQRKKPQGRMSLNVQSLSDLTNQTFQKSVLNDQLGGETTFNAFVHNLVYQMKKIEFFELFFEEFTGKTEAIKFRVSSFLMNVFTNNTTAVLAAVQEFLNHFNTLTDSNIFELKAFLLNFLTANNGSNNTFPDKKIAFQLIESIEVYRNELTGNESAAHLFELSSYSLADNLSEHLVTSEFFKKQELDKLTQFSTALIALIFNKISCGAFIAEFESCFQVSLTPGFHAVLRDILKKVLSDLKEFNSVFRKNVSYQLKKVQWLLSGSQPSYISIVSNAQESLFGNLSKLLAGTDTNPNKQKAFIQFIKACYSPFNMFNMIDIFELYNPIKDSSIPNQVCVHFCSVFRQALINSKIPQETAKKIETFTLSIFE